MNVVQEWLQWDDEDGSSTYPNTNAATGSYPYALQRTSSRKDWKLHFCYYTKA